MAKKKKSGSYMSRQQIHEKYGITMKTVNKYFPPPDAYAGRKGKSPLWSAETVARAVSSPPLNNIIASIEAQRRKNSEYRRALDEYLLSFDIENMKMKARSLNRRFILHVGPTNSGKTYASVERLREASSGAYLGPLRLLALEMFDRLNADDFRCSLLTGEEHIEVPGSRLTASTIELCDYSAHYEVAVIDEAQLIEDKFRGDKWTRAIYCVDAEEVHICLAPYALDVIKEMLESFDAPYEVIKHERLAPLEYAGVFRNYEDVESGDALIVFSRKSALALSSALENLGIKVSTIYGALPPASRREEVRKFTSGESTVVVSTDAIGMGVSLPIKRIIFCETSKYDGIRTRPLNAMEIRQIAGRAGRYGIYDRGEVLTMKDAHLIKEALREEESPIKEITIPFPAQVLGSDYPIKDLFTAWNGLPRVPGFHRQDMSDSIYLLSNLDVPSETDKHLIYDLITCPVDIKDDALVIYWLDCSLAIIHGGELPMPYWSDNTLESCERLYKAYDIRHQLLRRIGVEEDRTEEKDRLCRKINEYLASDKDRYLKRCRVCGRILPPTYPYGICDRCFRKQNEYW